MDLINKWLSGKKNFHVGAILYKKFGTDEKLKKLFEGKPDPYTQKRLEEALVTLAQKPKVVLQSPSKTESDEMPASVDPVLSSIRQQWRPIYQRMNYLRHELDKYEGNSPEVIAKREPIAFEILDLEQQCMVIWKRRRHYEQHGSLPDVKPVEAPLPDDPVELGKMIETAKRNIRRNKQYAAEYPNNPSYPQRVKNYEAELERILKKTNDAKRPIG
jgi:hypothetical protein